METRGYRILLVDDRADDYQLIHSLLLKSPQMKDCELCWINTYDLAILSVQVDKWDAILVNHRVGQHSGLEFIHHALLWKNTLSLILLSDYEDPGLDYKARKIGACDCVAKGSLDLAYLKAAVGQPEESSILLPHLAGGQITQVLGRLL